MPYKKYLLIIITLAFLAGDFSLNRIGFPVNIEVRYLFILLFFIMIFMRIHNFGLNKLFIFEKSVFLFLTTIFLYFFVLLISVFISESIYDAFKYYLDTAFILVLIFGLLILISKYEGEELLTQLSGILIITGLIFTIPVIVTATGDANRGQFSLGGPNVITRFIFFAFCSSIYRYISMKDIKYIIISLLFFVGIIFIGSRGGLLGAIVTLMVLLLLNFNNWKHKMKISGKKVIFLLILVTGVSIFYNDLQRIIMGRYINLTFSDNGLYTSGRDELYAESLAMISESPVLGHGINGFYIRTGELYPHNIVLEMMNNIGILGLLFFFIFLFYSVYLIIKFRKTKLCIFSGLPFYMIIVHMFSGSIYDFRFYFFWTLLLLYVGRGCCKTRVKTRNMHRCAT